MSKDQETIKKSVGRNIRFVKAALTLVKSTHITQYSCKYSKKVYNQYQLLVLILFKEYRNQHYRDFVEDVGDREQVQQVLDFPAIPHFTTLQKFLRRIKSLHISYLFGKMVDLFYTNDDVIPITAIDSSGFTSGYSSHYYSARTGKIRNHFLKTSISVDTEQQVITGVIISKSRVHDTRHARRLLRQCHKRRKSEYYVMDKGYDSEAIHRQIRALLIITSCISVEEWRIVSGELPCFFELLPLIPAPGKLGQQTRMRTFRKRVGG